MIGRASVIVNGMNHEQRDLSANHIGLSDLKSIVAAPTVKKLRAIH